MSYGYRTSPVNTDNSGNRSMSVKLPAQVWNDLDKIARQCDKSKQELLEPIISQFVQLNKRGPHATPRKCSASS